MNTKYNGPASNATVCDECGGPTYLFQTGSIWCPDEDKHAGGHFVVRVAFERAPIKTGATPRSKPMALASVTPVSKPKPKADEFGGGFDSFIEKE